MINLSILQILIALLSLVYIINSASKLIRREKRYSILKFIATLLIWSSVFFISVFPTDFKKLLKFLGLQEDVNFIIFAGFIIIFVLIFRLLNIIEGLERNITEIVRKEALKQIKK